MGIETGCSDAYDSYEEMSVLAKEMANKLDGVENES